MRSNKLYFLDESSNMCYPLDYHIERAKEEGLKEVELFEAVPDTFNKNMLWCLEFESMFEKSDCNKSCPYYKALKGTKCDLLGSLLVCGEKVKFDIDSSLPFLNGVV